MRNLLICGTISVTLMIQKSPDNPKASARLSNVTIPHRQQCEQHQSRENQQVSAPSSSALDTKVLVLNRHYLAIRIITARRAFVLLVKEQAEVIAVEDSHFANYDFPTWVDLSTYMQETEINAHEWVQTSKMELPVPKIIRLYRYNKLPRKQVQLNRRNIFARDRNRCQYCGSRLSHGHLSIDHVTPRSQGGVNSWENLVCSCHPCNTRKGGRTPKQANMKLVRSPRRPKWNAIVHTKIQRDRFKHWKTFLDGVGWSIDIV